MSFNPSIFNVFTRRHHANTPVRGSLSQEFRTRISYLIQRTYNTTEFWQEIYDKLVYLLGRGLESAGTSGTITSQQRDAILSYLDKCRDDQFLDFIELVMQAKSVWESHYFQPDIDPRELVNAVNEFFKADAIPYYLTDYASIGGTVRDPQVIRRDNEVLHQQAIGPVVTLLGNSGFASADEEFRNALQYFRKGDNRNCVLECGNSVESVMKVICQTKGWTYKEEDTFKTLLDRIFLCSSLDVFFKQSIMVIASARNRFSKAHGAGTVDKSIPDHVANYVIGTTATSILFLVEATN